jgi:hypothetical protein
MSKKPVAFLKHIADECSYLLSVNKDLSKDNFLVEKYGRHARSSYSRLYWSELLNCLGRV